MKAAVSSGIQKIEICDMPKPVLEKGEALIKVSYCGICGSDMNGFLHGDPFAPFPHVFGHEGAGTIVEVCGETENVRVGDRVVFEIVVPCGVCLPCREGRYSDCAESKIIGGHLPGAFAEYVKVPCRLLHRIPDNMPMKLAAACEPYTIASRGCERGGVGAKDTVLILGAGNISLCAIAVAKELGAKVIVAARSEERLERVRSFEPNAVINTQTEDVKQRIAELTDGNGVDVILEITGACEMVEAAVDYARRATRIVLVGMCKEKVSLSAVDVVCKEFQIIGTQCSFGEFVWVIEKISQGRLHAEEFITDVFDYTQAQQAMEYAIKNAGKCGKVLLKFAG